MIDFIHDLNPEQQRAVETKKGPILILAGAGSGKTRVITYRIAYLIQQRHATPRNILAITFTNKAADEMRTRVHTLLRESRDIWVRTYHSTCARILRESLHRSKHAREIVGVEKNYTIYDEYDQTSLMKECLKELKIDPHDVPAGSVCEVINRMKQDLRDISTVKDDALKELSCLYNKKLEQYNAVDFGDLIMKTVILLQEDDEIKARYQRRFKYILVDEYQDTNRAQYVLTKLLAEKHRNLCVVGDDDQSIYSWRGAEIHNILDFEDDFPDAIVIKLEQNYRSTKTILSAASAVVQHNEYRKPKTLWCDGEKGEGLEFYSAEDTYNEAAYVARKVTELRLNGSPLHSMAIFYRINYQSRVFEECFVRFQIPYEVVGSLKFYERAEIKNILAYLKTVHNPHDSVSLKRIINVPSRKIGLVTLEKIDAHIRVHGGTLYDGLLRVAEILSIDRGTKKRIHDFTMMIEKFRKLAKKEDLHKLVLTIARDSGYLESFSEEKTDRDYVRRKNIEELLISIKNYVEQWPHATIQDYLSDVSLRSDIDEWNAVADKVSLMTLHNAKGLEFDNVFITGLEDGLIPHYRSQDDQKEYEEERRLLYVGITRARKKLFVTHAMQREMFRGGTLYTTLSPFFREIPTELFATTVESEYEF